MSHTKAVHLKSFRKFVTTRASENMLERIFQSLSEADRAVVTQPWMSGQWLDYQVWWRLLLSADKLMGTGDYRIIYDIGAFDAVENLNTIYKAFIAMLNVKTVISQSQLIWRRYYDTGVMQVVRLEDAQAELHLQQYPDLPKHHEHEIIGWMEAALRLTGAKYVKLRHTTCIAEGCDHCTFFLEWRDH